MKISCYVDRDETIKRLVIGKSVLHIGCVGFTDCHVNEKVARATDTLHATITNHAVNTLGIDNDCQTIAELKEAGVFGNIMCGDAEMLSKIEELKYNEFDVVVAGDIIEHLSNPGLMLDGVKRLLGEKGTFVVSTPNSFGLVGWLRFFFNRFKEGEQHVLCFNAITLKQLLVRHGFKVNEALSCFHPQARNRFGLGFNFLRRVLGAFPRFGGTLIYVCQSDTQKE